MDFSPVNAGRYMDSGSEEPVDASRCTGRPKIDWSSWTLEAESSRQ